MQEKQLKTSLE